MKHYLANIRQPRKKSTIKKQIYYTIIIVFAGFLIGILQKFLDSYPDNYLPMLLQIVDIGNYFGRLSIWILLATILSIYSETPIRASVNVLSFFLSMLLEYYLYSKYILGFLPVSYMMIWVVLSFISTILAYICWYAKGKGLIATLITSGIMGVLLAQAFHVVGEIYMYHIMEVITWLIGVVVLRRKPKEWVLSMGISVLVAIGYQCVFPYFG